MANINPLGYDLTTGQLRGLSSEDSLTNSAGQSVAVFAEKSASFSSTVGTTIPNGTNTTSLPWVQFQSTGSEYTIASSTRITVATTGQHVFLLTVGFDVNATGNRAITVFKNGAEQPNTTLYPAASGNTQNIGLAAMLSLVANDYIQINPYQTSGANRTCTGYIQAYLIGSNTAIGANFKANRNGSNQTISSGGSSTTIIFDNELYDTANGYDTSTGKFTVPSGKEGKWHFSCGLAWDTGGTSVTSYLIHYNSSNVEQGRAIWTAPYSGTAYGVITTDYNLSSGDYVRVEGFQNTGSPRTIFADTATFFSGFRIV